MHPNRPRPSELVYQVRQHYRTPSAHELTGSGAAEGADHQVSDREVATITYRHLWARLAVPGQRVRRIFGDNR
jgi:hypothetical protein